MQFGPETWLPAARDDARYTADSISYIEGDRQSLENEVMARTPENVVVYGAFERRPQTDGSWTFSGIEGIEVAESVAEAVQLLNENGYEVVSVTESGAPGGGGFWSNMYIFGRRSDY